MKGVNAYFVARTVVHLVVAGIGLAIVWMGYQLFRDMPLLPAGNAKIDLFDKIEIYFSQIGPGAVFVVFGGGLIAYMARRAFTFQSTQGSDTVTIQGFVARSASTGRAVGGQPAASTGLPRPGVVRTLAQLAAENDAKPINAVQIERANALRVARAQIMLAGWDKSWGSQEDFQRWVDNGAPEPPPESASRAAAIYQAR